MSFFEQFKAYALKHVETAGQDVTYTPQGGAGKVIKMVIPADQNSVFYTGTDVMDYDVNEVVIYSGDDTNGQIAPSVTGRDGAGDSLVMPTTGTTFWVKKVLLDGRDAKSYLHRLLIANTRGEIEGA